MLQELFNQDDNESLNADVGEEQTSFFETKIDVTYFENHFVTIPEVESCSFDEFEDDMKDPVVENNKDDLPAICPATFLENSRSDRNVIACSFLGIDLDDLPVDTTILDVHNCMRSYRGFVYTTHSHLEPNKGARFRVIFALDKPIPGNLYSSLYCTISEWFTALGGAADSKCKNPSHLLYVPAVHEERRDRYQFLSAAGKPIVWSDYVDRNQLSGTVTNTTSKAPTFRKPFDTAATVFEGNRNDFLYRFACRLRRAGLSESEIIQRLLSVNQNQCLPPVENTEVMAVAKSACKYPTGTNPVNGAIDCPTLTQIFVAESIVDRHYGKLRFSPSTGKWLLFDETGWHTIDELEVHLIVTDELKRRKKDLLACQTPEVKIGDYLKHIEGKENMSFVKGTVDAIRSRENVAIQLEEIDSNIYHLGLPDGKFFDLKTNTLHTISHENVITRSIATTYDPSAKCPLWEKSILEWCCGDRSQVKFLQTWCGYSLSGKTDLQKFLFLYGGGKNGKSVFINTINHLLKDYAMAIQPETLMMRNTNGGASGDIARLNKVRLASAIELPDGQAFNENLLKQLTGGDVVVARHLYRSEFEFVPHLKLMICGNHKPTIRGFDDGVWRRVLLVPFVADIKVVDSSLTEKLKKELPGILNWCIQGWNNYQNGNMAVPKCVEDATSEYRREMDFIKIWSDECVEKTRGGIVKASSLSDSLRRWCEKNGYRTIGHNRLSPRLKQLFGNPVRRAGGMYYEGMRLRSFDYMD